MASPAHVIPSVFCAPPIQSINKHNQNLLHSRIIFSQSNEATRQSDTIDFVVKSERACRLSELVPQEQHDAVHCIQYPMEIQYYFPSILPFDFDLLLLFFLEQERIRTKLLMSPALCRKKIEINLTTSSNLESNVHK